MFPYNPPKSTAICMIFEQMLYICHNQKTHDMITSISPTPASELPTEEHDYASLASRFAAEQDIKDSSRTLYKRSLMLFFRWIESEKLSLATLTVADVNRYKDSLMARGLSTLTIGSYIVAVRRFFEWTEAKRWYPNIARGVKTPKRQTAFRKQHLTAQKAAELLHYYSGDQAHAIPSETRARNFAIVNLILRTGLRTIEVVRADIADITFKRDRRVMRVWGKGRTDKDDDFVVLTDKAYQPIRDYLTTYRSRAIAGEPLFTSTANRNHGGRLTTRSIRGICKDGLRHIHLDGKEYTAHSLRHTTAVAILKAGGTINEVQAVLRHASIDTTRIYTQSIEEELRLATPPEQLLDNYFT